MNHIIIYVILIFNSLISMVASCHATINISKGKPYTVAPAQNYPHSAPPNDLSVLTDGEYTRGFFWTEKTTAGWSSAKIVDILIDLKQESDIGSIVFNTARGKGADVYYPSHIAAFVGSDREHLLYVGDLADDPENQPGSYQIKKFMLNNVGIRGRYVLLEAIPMGSYLFCDEIEVIEGTSGRLRPGSLTVEKAREFAGQLIRLDRDKELLNKMADKLAASVDKQSGLSRLHQIKQQIKNVRSVRDVDAIETEFLALRGKELINKMPSKKLNLQMINPWGAMNPVSPVSVSSSTSLSLLAPQNGYDSGAVLITNLSENPIQVSASLDKIPSGSDLVLYQVPFIKTAAMEQVADPLVPAKNNFTLRSGESRMLFVTIFGKRPGKWNSALRITSDGDVTTLPLAIQVASVVLPKKLSLNSVNWAYLDFKLIRDRQHAAVADLLEHHTNVVVVSPAFLPNPDPTKPLDFNRMESYLKLHQGADKLLLFMNLRPDSRLMLGGGYPFLGEQWKSAVKRWIEGARQAAARAGFKPDQVYWYPFDEMQGKEIDQFIALAQWARSEIPNVKLYATLDTQNSDRALPYLDIAQFVRNGIQLKNITSIKPELWLYDTRGPAKSQSPYSYYRMMAWTAFLHGYKGIGFWAYADTGDSATSWNDFENNKTNYSVIYDGKGTSIISSRRWEAWRMGIEDYELLTMYSKAKGDAAAKALAKSVLDNPLDTSKADEVRRMILLQLSR